MGQVFGRSSGFENGSGWGKTGARARSVAATPLGLVAIGAVQSGAPVQRSGRAGESACMLPSTPHVAEPAGEPAFYESKHGWQANSRAAPSFCPRLASSKTHASLVSRRHGHPRATCPPPACRWQVLTNFQLHEGTLVLLLAAAEASPQHAVALEASPAHSAVLLHAAASHVERPQRGAADGGGRGRGTGGQRGGLEQQTCAYPSVFLGAGTALCLLKLVVR